MRRLDNDKQKKISRMHMETREGKGGDGMVGLGCMGSRSGRRISVGAGGGLSWMACGYDKGVSAKLVVEGDVE